MRISSTDETIDSRDVFARIDELEALPGRTPAEDDELSALIKLDELATAINVEDWADGATLVHDAHFTEYVEQMATHLKLIDSGALWIRKHVDWIAAANNLKRTYQPVIFEGQTYWAARTGETA